MDKNLERMSEAASKSHDRPTRSAFNHLQAYCNRLENKIERIEARTVELYAIVEAIQEAQMIGGGID